MVFKTFSQLSTFELVWPLARSPRQRWRTSAWRWGGFFVQARGGFVALLSGADAGLACGCSLAAELGPAPTQRWLATRARAGSCSCRELARALVDLTLPFSSLQAIVVLVFCAAAVQAGFRHPPDCEVPSLATHMPSTWVPWPAPRTICG